MLALVLLVSCLLAVAALGKLKLQASQETLDLSRLEHTPFARFLLEYGNPEAARLMTSRRTSASRRHIAPRRGEIVSSLQDRLSETEFPHVRWMALNASRTPRKGSRIKTMPLFLQTFTTEDGVPYLPYTTESLTIFEPRYCEMYEDIIYSGNRHFAVGAVNDEGNVMETAVVFYLNDLRKIPKESGRIVRYIGEHTVVGRVNLLEVINLDDRKTKGTYLRARVEDIADVDADVDTSAAELEVKNLFRDFVFLQHRMKEDVRFSTNLTRTMAFDRTADDTSVNLGLWGVVTLWKQFLEARVQIAKEKRSRHMKQFQRSLEADDLETAESKSTKLSAEILKVRSASKDNLRMANFHPTNDGMLAMIQSSSHSERLSIFKQLVNQQYRRLQTMEALKALME